MRSVFCVLTPEILVFSKWGGNFASCGDSPHINVSESYTMGIMPTKMSYEAPEIEILEILSEGCVLSGSVPTLRPGESEDGSWGEDL